MNYDEMRKAERAYRRAFDSPPSRRGREKAFQDECARLQVQRRVRRDKFVLRYRCQVCSKLTRGRKPKRGDGSEMFPRRHKHPHTGHPCPGNILHAYWVKVKAPNNKAEHRTP